MHDAPAPTEVLSAAATLLRDELIPALPPEQAFKARVLANALDLVSRQLSEDPAVPAAAHRRLIALTGKEGTVDALNAALAGNIEGGEVPLTDPTLLDHLWQTTLAKLAVDQPRYASFLAETGANP